MPIFDKECNINSPKKTILAFIGFAMIIAIILFIAYSLCSMININPLIGLLIGGAISIGLLWFLLDILNNKLFSPSNRYLIVKKRS